MSSRTEIGSLYYQFDKRFEIAIDIGILAMEFLGS